MKQPPALQQFDYMRYARLLWRHKWIVFVPPVLFALFAALWSMQLPDRFRSTTLILVQPQKVPDRFIPSTVTASIEDRLQTISQQIFSRTRLEKVIKEFNLFEKERQKLTPEEVVNIMRRRIDLQVHRQDSFRLSYEDSDPRLAMLVTNKLASLFIEENLKVREQQAMGTSQFLAGEIERYREQVRGLEEKITEFKRKHIYELPEQVASNRARLSQLQNRLQINADNLNGAENRRIQVQDQIAEIERSVREKRVPQRRLAPAESISAQLERLFQQQAGTSVGATVDMSRVRAAEAKVREVQSEIDALLLQFTPKHPEVVAARNRLKRLQREVEAERQAVERQQAQLEKQKAAVQQKQPATPVAEPPIKAEKPTEPVYPPVYQRLKADLRQLESEIQRIREQNQEIEQQIEMYQARIAAAPRRQMELEQLSEDYDNLKGILEDLVDKKLQADLSGSLEKKQKGEQFKVLDPANLPARPVSPNRMLLVLTAGFFGFALGGGAVLLVDFLCPGPKTRDELKSMLSVPVLASVSEIVTPEGVRRQRRTRLAAAAVVVLVVAVGAIVVHVAVKPLPVAFGELYAKAKTTHWTTMKPGQRWRKTPGCLPLPVARLGIGAGSAGRDGYEQDFESVGKGAKGGGVSRLSCWRGKRGVRLRGLGSGGRDCGPSGRTLWTRSCAFHGNQWDRTF